MPRTVKPKSKGSVRTPKSADVTPDQLERAYAVMPELQEPDKAAKRAAFIVVVVLIIAVGMAGAAIEIFLKPLLANPPMHGAESPREVFMQVNANGYDPAVISLRVGQPVRWIIDATNASGCGYTLFVPDLEISRALEPTLTVIEFTPEEPGNVPFSCASTELQGHFVVS